MEHIAAWRGKRRSRCSGPRLERERREQGALAGAHGPDQRAGLRRVLLRGGIFYLIHSSALYRHADFEAIGGYTTEYGAANELDLFAAWPSWGWCSTSPSRSSTTASAPARSSWTRFWDQRRGVLRLAENQRRRGGGQPPDRRAGVRRADSRPSRRSRGCGVRPACAACTLPPRRDQHGQRTAGARRRSSSRCPRCSIQGGCVPGSGGCSAAVVAGAPADGAGLSLVRVLCVRGRGGWFAGGS